MCKRMESWLYVSELLHYMKVNGWLQVSVALTSTVRIAYQLVWG
jgi:hypothetical protein